MYKNQLQELAQRSCFNFPSYACIREGPDHAPRFKASVNFNGEIFEGPSYSSTLRQAEHAAAQVAVNTLSARGPSKSLTARVLDETGVYKNLLQETAHRAGLNLPVYSTLRSGPGHVPVFTSTVELAGMNFTGESAKTKKQAEKNAALAAWSALKQMPNFGSSQLWTSKSPRSNDEQAQVVLKRVISNFKPKDERKSIRQRDENQARRRMLSDSSGSSSLYSLQYKQLGPMKPLPDLSSICPLHLQNQTQMEVMALSKILPPTSSRDVSSNKPIPVQVRRSQVKIQEIPAPVEEQRHDEEEWMNGRSSGIDKSIEEPNKSNSSCPSRQEHTYGPVSISNNRKLSESVDDHSSQQTQIRCRSFRHPTQPPTVTAPLRIDTKGFRQHCMAPAVHVRSPIPVYATPPIKKEASLQTLDRISGSTQTGETASSFSSRSN